MTAKVISLEAIREARRILDNNEPEVVGRPTYVLTRWEAVHIWGCPPEVVDKTPANGIVNAPNGDRVMLAD